MRLPARPASAFFLKFPKISAPASFLPPRFLSLVFSLGVDLAALAAIPAAAKDKKPKTDPALKGLPIAGLSPDEAILHALNRLAYGPRPGDIEHVRQMGLAKWIASSNSIPTPSMTRPWKRACRTIRRCTCPPAKLIDEYPQPKQAEKQAEKQAQARAQQEQRRSDAAATVVEKDMQNAPGQPAQFRSSGRHSRCRAATLARQSQRARADETANARERTDKWHGKARRSGRRRPQQRSARGCRRQQKAAARGGGTEHGQGDARDLQRAATPARLMDDFWFNHFNVFAAKGEDRYYLTSYERDVIQPHAFGKFKDW